MMFNEADVLRTTVILTFVLTLGLFAMEVPVALGLLLGGLMSSLALRLMIIDATALMQAARTTELSRREVSRFNRRSFLKRCSLYAAALTVGALNPYLSFVSVFLGLLMPRLAIVYHLLQGRIKRGT
jgi:hypothetical protein